MGTRSVVFRLLPGFLAFSFLLSAPRRAPENQVALPDQSRVAARPAPQPVPDFGKIPLQFIPNRGQKDGRVAYYVAGRDKTIFFTAEGLTYVLGGQKDQAGLKKNDTPGTPDDGHSGRWVVRLDFVKPSAKVKPAGMESSGTVVSYFKGRPSEWKTGLAACSTIAYRDLWPGIDLIYSGSYDAMKYEFLVHPGADPTRIRLAYRGAEAVALTTDGRLEARTPAGTIADDRPIAYQEEGGARRAITVAYDLVANTYGFRLGDYDPSRPLVLDPSVLVYCGYIGGEGHDAAHGIAVDGEGNAYVVGFALSTESSFPVTVGPDLAFHPGDDPHVHPADAFVAKVNASGTALEYCGYIGGSEDDWADGIAVDAMGNAYVTGTTGSSEADFPVVMGPDLTYNGGEADSWVAKIDPTGTALLYCGYIGGLASDMGRRIAVDEMGRAYVGGETWSNQASFPVAVGPDLTYNDYAAGFPVRGDVFVAKLDASGTALEYCGYIGGGYDDYCTGIAIDGSGCAYVTGYGQSTESTFPVKVGPNLIGRGGFVAKVSASGETLVYCGFVGGECGGIAVDAAGSAYVASSGSVDKVKPDGTGLVYSISFIGRGRGIAVDAAGCAYITGEALGNLAPLVVGPDLTDNGDTEGFVAKVNASGTAFEYCGFIGGWYRDAGEAIAVDGSGNAYVVGTTSSNKEAWGYFPATIGPDLTFNGDRDAFIAKVPPNPVAPPLPILTAIVPDSCPVGTPDVTLALVGDHFLEGAVAKWHQEGFGVRDLLTIFVDSTRLEVPIETGQASVIEIYVFADGEVSNTLTFTTTNPLPGLDSISPTALTGGSPDLRIRVTGTNFVLGSSAVRWNGADLASYSDGFTAMWADVPSSRTATGGEVEITVYNPPPGGGTSNSFILPVSTFRLNASPTTATVNAGQAATFSIELTPQFGSFDAPVSFVSGSLPKGCAASFSPASVTPGASAASTTLTITTQARSNAAAGMAGPMDALPPALGLLLAGILALSSPLLARRLPGQPLRQWATVAVLIGAFIALGSCSSGGGGGDSSSKGTPAGTYQISVEGRSGSMAVSTTASLTVR